MRQVEKEGRKFSFVRFANTQTFETNDFMVSRDLDITKYPAGNDYEVTLEVDGKYLNVVELAAVAK